MAGELLGSVLKIAGEARMQKLEHEAASLRDSAFIHSPAYGTRMLVGSTTLMISKDLDLQQSREAGVIANATLSKECPSTTPDCARAEPTLPVRIFRREEDFWMLQYEGKAVRLRHLKGFTLIACLLRSPGRSFLASELAGCSGQVGGEDFGTANHTGDSPILDNKAKASYRERLRQLREELEEARSYNDQARMTKLEDDIAFLTRELARALGIFGHDREFPSEPERARLRVTNCMRAAIKRVSSVHPPLGRHLTNSIKTGLFCSYSPESSAELGWQT
jgi:hypothetical protein